MEASAAERKNERAYGRRPLLVGAASAVAGWLTAQAAPVRADEGDPVRLGRRNESAAPTTIVNLAPSETTLRARASGSGAVALDATSPRGTAVHGLTRDGNGVSGEAVFGIGVSGHSIEPGSFAVSGESTDGVGVQGGSHGGVGVQGNSQFGVAVQGGNVSETEPAVQGWAQNHQTGVMGRSTGLDDLEPIPSPRDVGVFGIADPSGGSGVLARSRRGWALRAAGRVKFSTSGTAVIASGASSVTVAPTFDVVVSAKVLAMLQGDPGNAASVRFVTIDPDAKAFTITTTEAVAVATPVAWFVLE